MAKKTTAKRTEKASKNGSKAITISAQVFEAIKKVQAELEAKLGGKVTYTMVIQALLQDRMDLVNVRSELDEIQSQAEQTQEMIKDLLKSAINKQPVITLQQPINPITPMPYNPMMMQGNYSLPSPPPNVPYPNPPPMPSNAPKPPEPPKPLKSIAPISANIKKDYQTEVKSIFTGDVLKPSEILKATNPKHASSEIKEIDGSKIPDLEQISHTEKNKDKFKTEHHDFKSIIPHGDSDTEVIHAQTPDAPDTKAVSQISTKGDISSEGEK